MASVSCCTVPVGPFRHSESRMLFLSLSFSLRTLHRLEVAASFLQIFGCEFLRSFCHVHLWTASAAYGSVQSVALDRPFVGRLVCAAVNCSYGFSVDGTTVARF